MFKKRVFGSVSVMSPKATVLMMLSGLPSYQILIFCSFAPPRP